MNPDGLAMILKEVLRDTSTPSYWHSSSTKPDIHYLRKPPEYVTVAIVGGGIMGVSTAYWLARAAVDVLVIERRGLAWGASGRNAGVVTIGPADEHVHAVQKLGRAVARQITQSTVTNQQLLETVIREEGVAVGYSNGGFLSLACSDAELQILEDSSSLMRADGFPADMLDRAECEELIGTKLGPRFLAGAYSPGDSKLHPVDYVHGMALASHRRGVQLLIAAAVSAPYCEDNIWSLSTSLGTIKAQHIVLATNESVCRFLPALDGAIAAVDSQIILTGPTSIRMQVGWAANEASEYGCQTSSGGVMIGGRLNQDNTALSLPDAQVLLTGYLNASFPALRALRATHYWTGTMGVTKDNLPIVTNGVRILQTNGARWLRCSGHGHPPSW